MKWKKRLIESIAITLLFWLFGFVVWFVAGLPWDLFPRYARGVLFGAICANALFALLVSES